MGNETGIGPGSLPRTIGVRGETTEAGRVHKQLRRDLEAIRGGDVTRVASVELGLGEELAQVGSEAVTTGKIPGGEEAETSTRDRGGPDSESKKGNGVREA